MNVLWEASGPVKASDVLERLPAARRWAQKTVNTFLARLVDKQAVSVQREGRSNTYTAVVPREACVSSEVSSLARRLFRGAPGPMLMHFIKNETLSDEEIDQLRAMLEDKRP